MRALPLDIGVIHFVGIGGIGMSGIAETLHNLGYNHHTQNNRETAGNFISVYGDCLEAAR